MTLRRYPERQQTKVTEAEIDQLVGNRDDNYIIKKNGNSAIALARILKEGKEEIIILTPGWHDQIFTNAKTQKELKYFLETQNTKLTILFTHEPKRSAPDFLADYLHFKSRKLAIVYVSLNLAGKFFDIGSKEKGAYAVYPVIVDRKMCHLKFYPAKHTKGSMYSCTSFGKNDTAMVTSNLQRLEVLMRYEESPATPPHKEITETILSA
jgi:hypothetical protein